MRKRRKKGSQIEILNPNAAGIDIGATVHYVAIPEGRSVKTVRTFESFTKDLHEMARWLMDCDITTVAMESTGVYWIPVYQILEDYGFEVILANASHVKNVPGRKTDVSDCQWIQQLHSFGLLRSSFRPTAEIATYRSYVRQRDSLVKSASTHIHRMQKALEQMNLHLHKVISSISGETGMKIITAIIHGERDPLKLANMKNHRIKSSVKTIAKSLEGDWREEHLFVLRQELDFYRYCHDKIKECDERIEALLSDMHRHRDIDSPLPIIRKSQKNQPEFDLRTHLYHLTGVDLTAIDGISAQTVQVLISECGYDMSKWLTEKHFTSWLGLCPNNKITGQKIQSSRSRKVVNRAASALRMSAQTLHHSKSALGAFYRRMKGRLGPAKANTATARKLACLFYNMLKYGKEYVDQGMDYYEEKYKERSIKYLEENAKRLGYNIVKSQMVTDVVP